MTRAPGPASITTKLGAQNRARLAALAVAPGLVRLPTSEPKDAVAI
jgi:hypothetical protein